MNKVQTQHNTLVSIILPVQNCERYIKEALDSMISQTYTNWEMIVVDDGSTDNTPHILKKYTQKDTRIELITHTKPTGISRALNHAIKRAKGRYIARMDGDDISYSTRLEKQVDYLKNNPYVVAIGTQCDIINSEGILTGTKIFPTEHSAIYSTVFSFNPLQHPTLMIDRNILPKSFIFYDNLDGAEDLSLLFKLFPYGKVENLPDTLLAYRIHAENSSLKKIKKIFGQALQARLRGIFKYRYIPSLKSIIFTLAQIILFALLPERILRHIYFYARGMTTLFPAFKKARSKLASVLVQ